MSRLLIALLLSALGLSPAAAQITVGPTPGTTQQANFEDLAGGTSFDSIVFSGGVGIAERFVGQTLTDVGGFDQLGGSPSGPLRLKAGAPGRNVKAVDIDAFGLTVVAGLGSAGHPDPEATGKGALAVLFSSDQSQISFRFDLFAGGDANVGFYRRNGSLIDHVVIPDAEAAPYGFVRDGGVHDIAGFSLWFDGGSGNSSIDNLRYDVVSNVPEPSTWALMLIGLAVLGWASRRRLSGQPGPAGTDAHR